MSVGGGGVKPALCFRGRNQAHAVVNEGTRIRVVSNIPLRNIDQAAVVLGPYGLGQKEYPVDKFVERFLKLGEQKGITRRAKFLLEKALSGGVEDDTVLPPDEPEAGAAAAPKERPASPEAPKPGKPVSEPVRKLAGPSRTSGADVIRRISAELKLEPTKLRKLLRSKGLSAPYTDEMKIRGVLK